MDEIHPFPLLAIVGQPELKTALILALINPQIGGILLSGPYGVGKTTAVRGLLDILPEVEVEEENEPGNVRTVQRQMRLIELPLNARLEDVVGGINERVALEQHRVLLEDGVLAKAHRNLLYVDEINLLDPRVADAILDAAAQGRTMVRRGAMIRLFPSQFVLIGSMNPEEGTLRPQIMDRFGLRVWVSPLAEVEQRLEIYRRSRDFRSDPSVFRRAYDRSTYELREEVAAAREILPHVVVPSDIEGLALALIQQLRIPSHRAEISLLEGARARAAADFRSEVIVEDIRRIAPLALRNRRSVAIEAFAARIEEENIALEGALDRLLSSSTPETASPAQAETQPEQPARTGTGSAGRGKKKSKIRDVEQGS